MKLATLLLPLLAVALLANAAAAQVNVYFANQTGEAANVEWLNGTARQFYMTVPAGETRVLQSYEGHRWEMSNSAAISGATVAQANQVITLVSERAQFVPAPIVPQFEMPRQPQFPQQPVVPQIQPQQNTSSVNQGVLNYAQSAVGRKIGNGQCTELAIAALQAAGARPNSGYTWGTQLRSVNELQPGDVVQLHDARFEYANGNWSASTGPHTAIVTSVQGSVIQVLEQNISSSPVQAGQYDVTYMTAGRIEFYRPVAAANQQAGFGGRGFPETQAGNGFQPRKLQGKTWQNALPELPRRPLFE